MERENKDRYTKAVDDTISIQTKQENGVLRYSINVDKKGRIVRYSFAYINFYLCAIDNGRVIGWRALHEKAKEQKKR